MDIGDVWGMTDKGTIHGGYGGDTPIFLKTKLEHNLRVGQQLASSKEK